MARMVNLYNHPDVQKIDRHYTLDTLPPDTPQSPSSGRVKMSGSFEKSVKGATKIKNAPPKAKYVDHILLATKSGEAGIAEVFRTLQYRLRDSTWTVVFKGLMVCHLMVKEGSGDVTLAYISRHRNVLAISSFTDAQTQGRNIRRYSNYLSERAKAYRDTNVDWVAAPDWKIEKMTVDRGILREIEAMLNIIQSLLKCDVLENEPETEITNAVFKLLVLDLLALFQVLNQALIKMLSFFFEMSKTDAERALAIYKDFTKYTDYVVQYLSVARLHEHRTGVKVPKIKHAPVNLGRQLEDYLKDPDFDVHRRQYLAESEFKKSKDSRGETGRPIPPEKSTPVRSRSPAANNPFPTASNATSSAPKANKGPDPDLIDFFESIEQNQTTMQVAPQPTAVQNMDMPFASQQNMMFQQPQGLAPQQTGFNQFQQQQPIQQQQTGMFMQQQPLQQMQQPQQLQPNFTGAGFGGFTPQPQNNGYQPSSLAPIPQNTMADFQNQSSLQPQQTGMGQQQTTNPFRQSMMIAQPTGVQNNFTGFGQQIDNRQSTNPFARSSPQTSSPGPNPMSGGPFQQPQQQQQQQQQQQPQPLIAQQTGTNPFARNQAPAQNQQQQQGIAPQPTGTTNPFRHGDFMNHNTGMGWQHNQMPIGGGLDQIQTVPVFPRPAQQTPWQQ